MPEFSEVSLTRLASCHADLQTLFMEVIKGVDCSILEGYRGKEAQEEAFRKGCSQLHFPNGKHNRSPSLAVDVAPYPIDWDNIERFKEFAQYVKHIIALLAQEGKISSTIDWGGDWIGFKDYPHWEIAS
jgi:peptidoglycan LD-endopeptidase CwlK